MRILEIESVYKTFRQGFLGTRNEVLRGLSFSLEEGEVYGFLGHNGAGKTTTIKLALGLLRPTSGGIRVFGEEGISEASRARIGYLSEEAGLYPHLNGVEMLRLVGELFRLRRGELERRVSELLEAVGLSHSKSVKIKHYSKGMRQRLGVAAALMNDPELLLLDEPYSGLDPVGRKQLRELLLHLKDRGKTILMSSHIVPDVEAVCDRVGILSGGRITRSLGLNEVRANDTQRVEVTISGLDAERIRGGVHGVEPMTVQGDLTIVRCDGAALETLLSDVYRNKGSVVEVRPLRFGLEDIFVETIHEAQGQKTPGEKKKSDEMVFTR